MMEYKSIQTPENMPTYGEFELRDMMPGMGTVVGTAMRRVLLSSVPGAAALWMRIEDVPHEFSTIPGVKEDVSQILLAVKRLILRIPDREVHSLYLDIKGRDAYAGDFTTDGNVEILNPAHKIATINETGRLKMELLVQNGRDHAMNGTGPEDKGKRRAPMGMIWLDPIYSPVEKVSVEVEEAPDREHLRLRVWTNGAISPKGAVDWSARILRELAMGLEKVKSASEEGCSRTRTQPIEVLGLSNRSFNRLKRARFHTVESILRCTRQELWDTPNLGPKTLMELEEKLAQRGMAFAGEDKAG